MLARIAKSGFQSWLLLAACATAFAAPGDWPEVRQNGYLTGIQPLTGRMKQPPVLLAQMGFDRTQPNLQAVSLPARKESVGLALVDGGLQCYNTSGRLRWKCHPAGINFVEIVATEGLDGDGVKELVVETHSRMWFFDPVTGKVKYFVGWDTSPANIRSYGLVRFLDLDGDGREDFLCLANFAQHHEVLLNKNGKMQLAWCHGWPESVTTKKVATTWPEPPQADADGDRKLEIVLSMFNSEEEGAWLIRIYDAVTGKLKYRIPGMIAVATADIDRDGQSEILANLSTDPTGVKTGGARVLRIQAGPKAQGSPSPGQAQRRPGKRWSDDSRSLAQRAKGSLSSSGGTKVGTDCVKVLWQDDHGRAMAPATGAAFRFTRGGATFALEAAQDGKLVEKPWHAPAGPSKPVFLGLPRVRGPNVPLKLLAVDLHGTGRNELLVCRDSVCTALRLEGNTLATTGEYRTSSVPVVADLDGDGKPEIVLTTVTPGGTPIIEARTPALGNKLLWRTQLPAARQPGLPYGQLAYLRTARFTGKPTPDLYLWAGTPQVRSVALEGTSGRVLWEMGELAKIERYCGPGVNLAAAYDYNGDGKEDLVFTNPDYYCVASGATGELLAGPLFPPRIFHQPSQGLYTFPVILEQRTFTGASAPKGTVPFSRPTMQRTVSAAKIRIVPVNRHLEQPGGKPLVGLIDGHYFQGVMSLGGQPRWYARPKLGENRCGCEGFVRLADGQWLMGFGRQNGRFACVNVADGSLRWELPLDAACGDVVAGDVDGDGAAEFLFGTSHGKLYAVGDRGGKPRVLWTLDAGSAVSNVILADVNGDGACEIIAARGDGYVSVFGPGGQ